MDLELAHKSLLNVLVYFDSFCKEHGVIYYLDSGTLLGAVRHKGFIPWDDDVDVTMTRENYMKFREAAKDMQPPFKLIEPDNYGGYFYDFTPRVIDLNSPMRKETEEDVRQNNHQNRICVDVFIIDDSPATEKKFKKLIFKHKVVYGMAMAHRFNKKKHAHNFKDRLRIAVLGFFGRMRKLQSLLKAQDELARKYDSTQTEYYYISNTLMTDIDKMYKKEWIKDVVYLPFEGYMMPCPSGYDDILTMLYGDYMTPPPETERISIHVDGE